MMPGESESDATLDLARWARVARLAELAPGSMAEVEVDNRAIALYRLESGEVFATDGYCTHGAASLADGFLDGDIVECPLHGGCFSVRDGKGCGDPIEEDLTTYAVRIVGDHIFVSREPNARVSAGDT